MEDNKNIIDLLINNPILIHDLNLLMNGVKEVINMNVKKLI